MKESTYTLNNKSIQNILSLISQNKIGLPEMQRPFVWKSTQVRDLIDSLYRGYPIGFIVTWKNPTIHLKDGTIAGDSSIIIDGQQRLTALSAALEGNQIIDNNYKRKRIYIAFNPQTEEFATRSAAIAKDSKWIQDISVFFQPGFDAFDYVIENGERLGLKGRVLNEKIQKIIAIAQNEVGIIQLKERLPINQVTDIFNRINQKGTKLSSADFAMSRLSADEEHHGNDLRREIEFFIRLYNDGTLQENIEKENKEFIQTIYYKNIAWAAKENNVLFTPSFSDILHIALMYGFHRGKLTDLISIISGRDFTKRTYTDEAKDKSYPILNNALQIALNKSNYQRYLMILMSLGMLNKKECTLSGGIINFGYALYLILDKQTNLTKPKVEELTGKWIVMSALTARYSGSSETKSESDIKAIVKSNENNRVEEYINEIFSSVLSSDFWNNQLPINLESTSTAKTTWRVFQMALVFNKTISWLSKNHTTQTIIEEQGNIHHIFPKAYLKKNGFGKNEYNQIANLIWITQVKNLEISDMAPDKYLANDRVIEFYSEENNQANAIPNTLKNYDYHEYNKFLKQRRILMANIIRDYFYKI